MNKNILTLAAIGLILFGTASASGQAQSVSATSDSLIRSFCSEVKSDSLQGQIQQLQNFGTRFYRATGYRNVAQWIRNKFIAVGCAQAVLDSFWYTNSAFSGWQYNVIATIPGVQKPDSIYILGGHYDCTSDNRLVLAPGADDNASGVAVAFEVARVMNKKGYQPQSTIKFIAFAAEEMGLIGSDTLARRSRSRNERIQMMINNDMISYCPDSLHYWKIMLEHYDNSQYVTNLADTCRRKYTSLGVEYTQEYIYQSDSYSYSNQNYPSVFCEEDTFNTSLYHTIHDSISYYNMRYTAEMAKVSLSMLLSENGTQTVTEVTEHPAIDKMFSLYPNYPNPFNPVTTIHYDLSVKSDLTLKVYNTMGQEIRTLFSGVMDAGLHSAVWNGRDNSGNAVGSGVYIYRLQAGAQVKSGKMILLK